MRTSLLDFAAEHGIGPVEGRIRLGGRLLADGAGELPVELCLSPSGAWLVAQEGRFVGRSLDAGDPALVRYERGSLRDRLVVERHELTVPSGKGGEAQRLIALGRLRRAFGGAASGRVAWKPDRYLEDAEPALVELVRGTLGDDDTLIAVLELAESEVRSELGATVVARTHLMLSAARVATVQLSELGDHGVRELDVERLGIERDDDGFALADGAEKLAISGKIRTLLAELVELAKLGPAERLGEAARRLWLASEAKQRPERSAELLEAASAHGLARAGILALLAARELGRSPPARDKLAAAILALRSAAVSSEELVEDFHRWQFNPESGRELTRELSVLGAEAEPWSLSLHRAAFARSTNGQEKTEEAQVRWHAELAEHELGSGDPTRAQKLVEARLKLVPPDEDAVLAPERATPAHLERVRLYEALCRVAERHGQADVRSLAALARLEPTSEARLLALANVSSAEPDQAGLIRRAAHTLQCLAKGGLEPSDPSPPRNQPALLDRSTLEERVRHPLARGGGRFATRLSELIATVPEPDLGFLRDFCEDLAEARHPEAARSLGRAVRLLGLPKVAAYVSHGARSVGLRAFGAREPFVLIGKDHLVEDGPYRLVGAELDFALCAELSHLAFGHQRVTSGEVWAGAAGKTREALALLSVVAPVLAEFGGPRTRRLLGRLSSEAIERAASRAAELPELFGRGRETKSLPLGQRNEELIAAHRLVQLSADRAGLLAAGDLKPALRALLLLRSDYREVLVESTERGMLAALSSRRAANPAFADLTVRARALIAFYLSPDFATLAGVV